MAFSLKKNFRPKPCMQQFYYGRPYAVSPAGDFLACACGEEVKIVSAADDDVRSTLAGDPDADVTSLALSLDDRMLFTASHSRLIRVWDLESSQISASDLGRICE